MAHTCPGFLGQEGQPPLSCHASLSLQILILETQLGAASSVKIWLNAAVFPTAQQTVMSSVSKFSVGLVYTSLKALHEYTLFGCEACLFVYVKLQTS